MIRAGLEGVGLSATPIPARIWRGFTNVSGWRES